MTRAEDCFTVFGRIGVMPGQAGSNQRGGSREGEDALREFPPVTLSVFTQRNVISDYSQLK